MNVIQIYIRIKSSKNINLIIFILNGSATFGGIWEKTKDDYSALPGEEKAFNLFTSFERSVRFEDSWKNKKKLIKLQKNSGNLRVHFSEVNPKYYSLDSHIWEINPKNKNDKNPTSKEDKDKDEKKYEYFDKNMENLLKLRLEFLDNKYDDQHRLQLTLIISLRHLLNDLNDVIYSLL